LGEVGFESHSKRILYTEFLKNQGLLGGTDTYPLIKKGLVQIVEDEKTSSDVATLYVAAKDKRELLIFKN
jgi:hypothetical protein